MKRLQTTIALALPISIVFGVIGYAFELFYLLALDFTAHEKLGVTHFVVSGASITLPPFIILFLISQVKKFFTTSIHEDDTKQLVEVLASTSFEQQVMFARASLVVSFIYAISTFLTAKFGSRVPMGTFMLLVVFFNLQNFLAAIILSPTHARFTVLFMFILSVLLCISAGGYGMGAYDRVREGVIRDDFVLKVENSGNTLQLYPKEPPFEVPFLSKVFKKLANTL